MNQIVELITRLTRILVWWAVVNPWERALRVRLGKHVVKLGPGVHLKIPFVDAVFKQSVRRRLANLPLQTLTTRDGKTLSLSGVVGYAVADLDQLYATLQHAEDTIINLALAAIADFVHTHDTADCQPADVATEAVATMSLEKYGLGEVSIHLTDFVYAKAYRLLSDTQWGKHGDSLQTTTCEAA